MPEIPIAGYKRDAITAKINSADIGNINDVIEFDKDAYSVTIDITYHYKEDKTTPTQYTVNYKLVKNGETYYLGGEIYNSGDEVVLAELPDVKGRTVIGWFDKGTFEERKDDEEFYPEGGDASEDEKEPDPPQDDSSDEEVVASLELVEQSALGFGQYGQYAKPGSTITVTSNRTFYAYALSSGGTVTYSAYLRINKVDAEGNPVAGAGFTVSNGSTTQGSIGLTDEQGQLVMGLLDVGDFTITETTVPEGYVAGEPMTVTVTTAHTREDPCTVTIVNARSGAQPTGTPSGEPTATPAATPTAAPSGEPTVSPTDAPSGEPTVSPTDAPSGEPTVSPADEPTVSPTDKPTARPTAAPTAAAEGEDVPKTGDSGLGQLYALLVLSGLGMMALALMLRRLRRS
ncbi:MAG: SpaA isopeptide-forming pilin-related protein [Candidatus Fimadaptatus sp.]